MSQDDRQWYFRQVLHAPAVVQCGLCGMDRGSRAIYCLEMCPWPPSGEMRAMDEVLMVWLCQYHYMFSVDLFARSLGHTVWGHHEQMRVWPQVQGHRL